MTNRCALSGLAALSLVLPLAAENLQTLDNGVIRIGVDLDMGGTISWFST